MDIKEAYEIMQRECGIEVGDTVKILRANIENELDSNTAYHTEAEISKRGRHGVVIEVEDGYIDVLTTLNEPYRIPFFVLEVIKKAEKENMITVNGKEYSESTIKKALQEYVK